MTAWSRLMVSAMPASSMMTRVLGPMRRFQSVGSPRPGVMSQTSLARVSWWPCIWVPSWAAAAAEGASPMTLPPEAVQAIDRASMAVVLPEPAGAIASCTRAPDDAISRTRRTCPGLSWTRFAAHSSSARSTAVGSATLPPCCPAAVRRRCSACRTRPEVNSWEPAT